MTDKEISFNMNIKEYNSPNPLYTPIQQVLYNRGIPIEEQKNWLNAD